MNQSVRSKILVGVVAIFTLAGLSLTASAQRTRLGLQPSVEKSSSSSDILRIRKMTPSTKNKTPIFKTAVQGQAQASQPDWWRVVVEYETKPDWIAEIEFTYYIYMKDQSNKGAEVMFRSSVSYVNVKKGRHYSDMFLHPNTLARMGRVEQAAVVIKVDGVVVGMESTAQTPNWWDRYRPVDGVLLNRTQTPFSLIDYDMFEQVKPSPSAR